MKAVLVIDIPNEYADRYNVNEMYVWSLTVQDKQGYEMFDITIDKPIHLKPMPKKTEMTDDWRVADLIETESGRMARCYFKGRNEVIDEITGETE